MSSDILNIVFPLMSSDPMSFQDDDSMYIYELTARKSRDKVSYNPAEFPRYPRQGITIN